MISPPLASRILLVLLLVSFGAAGSGRIAFGRDKESDQDRALAAVSAGQVVPLRGILDSVEQDFAGKMIQVELEDHGRGVHYEVKLLSDDGKLVILRYDASNGVLLNGNSPSVQAARRK